MPSHVNDILAHNMVLVRTWKISEFASLIAKHCLARHARHIGLCDCSVVPHGLHEEELVGKAFDDFQLQGHGGCSAGVQHDEIGVGAGVECADAVGEGEG